MNSMEKHLRDIEKYGMMKERRRQRELDKEERKTNKLKRDKALYEDYYAQASFKAQEITNFESSCRRETYDQLRKICQDNTRNPSVQVFDVTKMANRYFIWDPPVFAYGVSVVLGYFITAYICEKIYGFVPSWVLVAVVVAMALALLWEIVIALPWGTAISVPQLNRMRLKEAAEAQAICDQIRRLYPNENWPPVTPFKGYATEENATAQACSAN